MNYKYLKNSHDNMLVKSSVVSSLRINITTVKIMYFIVCVIFGAVACVPENPQIILPDPDSYTQKYANIDSGNVQYLKQMDVFQMDHDESAKLVLRYVLGGNKIVACCSKSNEIFVWDALTGSTLGKHTISNSNIMPYEFDSTGNLLLGKIEDNFFIWNTTTGGIHSCTWTNCDRSSSTYDDTTLGAILQSEGKLVIEFDDYEYSLYDVQRDAFIPITSLICVDCDYLWQVGSVAYDTANNRYVVIFQEGRLQMYYLDWTTSPIPSVSRRIVVNYGVEDDLQPIHAAKFDRSGRYLAIARGNSLKILEMKEKTARKKFEIEVNNITDLIFDQTGRFVFAASGDHLYVYDIKTGELAGTYDTPSITQLDISLDNRLVLWGEKAGQIHVLGISKSE